MESSRDGSTTPNSMVVLERGAGGISTVVSPSTTSRPPSGRRSRNMTPIQRSGSQLEMLPPDDEPSKDRPGSRTSSRTSHRPSSSSEKSPRQTQSAGSSGRRSRQGHEEHDAGFNRANSYDGLASPPPGESRPGSTIHKQVSLTTVKRNYETHGIPKNENWDFVPEAITRQTPLTNGTSHTHVDRNKTVGATGGHTHKDEGVVGVGIDGGNGDGVNVLSEKECTEERLNYLMEQLRIKDKEIKQHEERRKSGSAAKKKDSLVKNREDPSTVTDSYYVSTGNQPELDLVKEPALSMGATAGPPPFLEDRKEDKADNTEVADDEEDVDEEEDDEEEEGPTAPIELMGEFLDSVMEEDYETADKLCKMILIYEPENAECLQFKPLIEEMLKRLWHYQLYGSSSEDESGDDDEEYDDEEDDEEDEDDEDDDSDDDSESDSSDESEDEEEEETKGKTDSKSVVYPNTSDTSKSDAIH
ncbi:protein starmaker-like isoform X2 [Lytechinus variegatus]|uniref:protein starmaker-like isoform X2 n=1 Tax=Lytechinus variegatus TaxID=7654 RepID=UPI001BB2582C|nr:protein starmaker-like isoform X2 [Lytechinus variegatus]